MLLRNFLTQYDLHVTSILKHINCTLQIQVSLLHFDFLAVVYYNVAFLYIAFMEDY